MLTTNGPVNFSGALGRLGRPEHRHDSRFPDMAGFQSRCDQRFFRGKGATQQKRDEIVLPDIGNIRDVANGLAVAEHAVTGQVCPDIGAGRAFSGFWIAGIENFQHRAGLRIALAELLEILGIRIWQYDHVGLHETLRMSGCRSVIVARAAGGTKRSGCAKGCRIVAIIFAPKFLH